jgi:hypothetical protein
MVWEYATSPGCSVDVMHGRGSLLRYNIWVDIVYCYPCDDFNGVKIFKAVIIIDSELQEYECRFQIRKTAKMGVRIPIKPENFQAACCSLVQLPETD